MEKTDLRKYIQEVLNEDMDVGMYGDDMGTHSTGGIEGLKAIFIDPFLDVGKTGAAAVSGISSKVQLIIGGLIQTALSSIIPTMEVNWEELRKKDLDRANKIIEKYGEVFNKTNEALWTGDGALIRFLWDPGSFIATTAVQKSPDAALGLLRVLGGENETINKVIDRLERGWDSLQGTVGVNAKREKPGAKVLKPVSKNYGITYYGESLTKREKLLIEGFLDKFINWASSQNIVDAIDASPTTKKMKGEAERLVRAHLSDIFALAKRISSWDSTKKLNDVTDGDFEKRMMAVEDPDERKKAATQIARKVKDASKQYIIDGLEGEMEILPTGLHNIYRKAISQIKKI